jgi:uncharacterized GH25 family protein
VRRAGCAWAAALLLARAAAAHDFWIEPSTFHPAGGTTVAVGLRVGQNFRGDPVPRFSRTIEKFIVRQDGRDEEVAGPENADPAGFLRAGGKATAVIAYSTTGSYLELPAAKFEDYLRQEGLEDILAARAKKGDSAKPGRDMFFRYAKALLAGSRTSAAASQPMGLRYEIVPDTDPTAGASPLRGLVLYEGKPLAGALVVAMLRDDPAVRLRARSDRRGGFSFALPRAGVWLVKSVHVVAASFFSHADWESLWASLTFQLPEARKPGPVKGQR